MTFHQQGARVQKRQVVTAGARWLFRCVQVTRLRDLGDGHGLAGQQGFIDRDTAPRAQHGIGRNTVALGQDQ